MAAGPRKQTALGIRIMFYCTLALEEIAQFQAIPFSISELGNLVTYKKGTSLH